MFFVYILQSGLDASYYIGYTSNLERRLEEHNSGKTRYTSKKLPWELKYYEAFESKSEAIKRELFLKKQKNSEMNFKCTNFKRIRLFENLIRAFGAKIVKEPIMLFVLKPYKI